MKKKKILYKLSYIMIFLIGGFSFIFLYLLIFPSYNQSIQGGYFNNYFETHNSINLNDFNISFVQGNSMTPTFFNGSYLLIAKDDIQIGDIILINNTGKYGNYYDSISHRVIKIKVKKGITYYLTRGDNLKYNDYWTSEADVLGKVVGVLY